jgi:hypothetical protein
VLTCAIQACNRDREPGPSAADTLATAVVDTAADSAADNRPVIVFERRRTYDFDGDGTPENMVVQAAGLAWDSMKVVIQIQKAEGTLLYADTFGTQRYMGLDPDTTLPREEIEATIRREMEGILSNSSFVSTAANFDDANITLTAEQFDMTEDEFARFREDLMSRPMFRYYIGGESSNGITWSNVLKRFVETFACC